jgi:beta-galactosidase
VKDYEVYLSKDGQAWNSPVAKGAFSREAEAATVRFAKPSAARYLKFVALSEQNGHAFASVAELEALEAGSPLLDDGQ